MELVLRANSIVNRFVWGAPMLCLFMGTGIYLTLLLGFPQLRYFHIMWKELWAARKAQKIIKDKSISSFAAMTTAMAATVGTGNIAGVATALHLGGPGALFWMMLSALFAMCTKFAEIILVVHFRQKDGDGDWRGGTMYVLKHGAGQKWLAILFSLFAFLASLGIGATVQANSMAEALKFGLGIDELYSGAVLSFLVGLVIIGGLKRLSTISIYLVPFRVIFFLVSSAVVLLMNADAIPGVLVSTVKFAFSDPMAMPGAIAGWSVKQAIFKGVSRGVFSNEAGLGSAPMAHANADVDHPVRQGLYGIFEVFIDTIAICSMSALVILVTGALTNRPELTGVQLSLFAFESALGAGGKYALLLALALFAYTTILGWYWYAETAITYLLGVRIKPIIKVLWIVLIVFGAAGNQILGTVPGRFQAHLWDFADTLNGLMAIPNLICLLLLSGLLRKLVAEFDAKRESGDLKV